MGIRNFINNWKYEILLFTLIQHLYIGIFVSNLQFYTKVLWPFNMILLGIASIGIFADKGKLENSIKNILLVLVVIFPIGLPFLGQYSTFIYALYISYILFFGFIFYELMRFLVKPGYINGDLISASFYGFFLLIEISVFLFSLLNFNNPQAFKGVDSSFIALTFIDMVYFSSITLTTIGYGDILPNTYSTKLLAALFGILGQFYSVVLIGILISKFSSRENIQL
jgi:hypothetical protein